jgi:lysozyme family protein
VNSPSFSSVPDGWSQTNQARWDQIFARLMVVEGGYANVAGDRGGETKYGISLRFLKAIGGIDANNDGFADLDLNFDTHLDGHDIQALTPEIAAGLYLAHFYVGPGFWLLPRPFDAVLFDQAVNGGTTAAIKILQRALNDNAPPSAKVDGGLGPSTKAVLIEQIRADKPVLQAVRSQAVARYEAVVAADPRQRKFLDGWTRRARELGRV